jgi:hypothetical protein
MAAKPLMLSLSLTADLSVLLVLGAGARPCGSDWPF